MGITKPFLSAEEKIPELKRALNNTARCAARTGAKNFRILDVISSGPAPLSQLRASSLTRILVAETSN